MAPSESNLVAHARRELRLVGEDKDVIDGLCRVVQAFDDMGHSGTSAQYATLYLDKLLRFQPLSELTDNPHEWIQHAEDVWQSGRNPEVFSTDGGKTYTLLSERETAGGMVTTPLHHSKALPQVEEREQP
jgi:hypothetical protein